MKLAKRYTTIGGQAVIEGVMMRSPHFIAVAVRRNNSRISIRNKSVLGWAQKYPFLNRPLIRGVVTLFESMIQGMEALSFSADLAAEEETGQEISRWAIAGSMIFAFIFGLGLFVALPHFITVLVSSGRIWQFATDSPWFHLLDGFIKVLILLGYVYLIARMSDIQRVFQYHGAEHKAIYTFEAGEDLTVVNARRHSTLHPRCGTSFLLFLVLISILVFSIVFPVLNLGQVSTSPILNHLYMVGMKMVLMLPVAGLAYEFIKVCAFRMDNPLFRVLVWPGLILQKLTTREPTDDQLEVALASLQQVLILEKNPEAVSSVREILGLSELGSVTANLSEFLEGAPN